MEINIAPSETTRETAIHTAGDINTETRQKLDELSTLLAKKLSENLYQNLVFGNQPRTPDEPTSEWIALDEAIKLFGVPRKRFMEKIGAGELEFRKEGNRYKLSVTLTREHLNREAKENMEEMARALVYDPDGRMRAVQRSQRKRRTPIVAQRA